MYNICDELCFKSKNLYNYANYIIRQEFINNKKWLRNNEIDKILQNSEPYKDLGSQASQKVLMQLDKNWKSFFNGIKDWSKHPNKYLGKPNLPKYKKKDGKNIVMLKNIQFRIENDYIYFSWKPLKQFNNVIKTRIKNTYELMQLRIIPHNNNYIIEIIYQQQIKVLDNIKNDNICGIDLGVDNLATLTNNVGMKPIIINGRIIKSTNQYYNKKLAYYKSILKKTNNRDWSNRLDILTIKRFNKIKNYMHRASKTVVDYCIAGDIGVIVIGNNRRWKQKSKMNNKANQCFVQIPYEVFINMIKYKAENIGIQVIITEESYTSGTSFLDQEEPIKNNYDKSRRVKRGLFKSNSGILINSDVNGSLQIIKKVVPNAFSYGIEGVDFHPVVINL